MKRAIKNSIGILLLALALVVTQIPVAEVAAETSTTSDFQMNGDTLVKYVGTAKTVSVPATVKNVGEEAFAGNLAMQEISFKGSVENIAYRSFAGCTGLKKITIPNSVTEIGNGAFSDCTALKEVTIGKDLKTLGIGIFAGCTSLEKIAVQKENTNFSVADGALYNKEKTTLYTVAPVRKKDTYNMPSTVTKIAEYAFWGCNSIKTVSLSSNLKTIPAYAFSNCKSLQSLVIPYSVNSIELLAFSDCVNLETVSIPPSVTFIDATSFDGCARLKIVANVDTAAFTYYEEWKMTHANQVEYEDTGETGQEDNLDEENNSPNTPEQSGHLLGSSFVVGNQAVVFIDNSMITVYGTEQLPSQTGIEDGASSGGDGSPELVTTGSLKSTSIPKYTIVSDTIIADQAFYKSLDMDGYTMPEGILNIGEFAFARSNLSKAAIPSGVTMIDYGAFYHCNNLRDVSIPSTVTYIAPKAFEKSLWLENWLLGGMGDYLVVGDGILLAYKGGGGDIVLPDRIKQIAPEAFRDNLMITSIILPDSLIKIGEGAFEGCKNLIRIQGGANVTTISDRAFYGCPLDSFHVMQNVQWIGQAAIDFSNLSKSISKKVVVFDGTVLPSISYEESAERLSNKEARGPVLKDVLFAVVDRSLREASFDGTVLDVQANGFKGFIIYISSKDKQTVKICGTTLTVAEMDGLYIPEFIFIDGLSYQVEGKENLANYAVESHTLGEQGQIDVFQETEVFDRKPIAEAVLEGNEGFYSLTIHDITPDELKKGYESVYGTNLPEGAVIFGLRMVDEEAGVTIKKLGNSVLTVKLPLPATLAKKQLRVISTDRNGQIENVTSRYDADGALVIATSYLSSYAIYPVGNFETGVMDDSPDTGESIQPKWIWAAGLTCLAILIFVIQPRKKKNSN